MRASRILAATAAALIVTAGASPVAFATNETPSPETKTCGHKGCNPDTPSKDILAAATECSDEGVKVTLKNKIDRDVTALLKGSVNGEGYEKSVEIGGNASATESLTLNNGEDYSLDVVVKFGHKSVVVGHLEGTRQCASVGTPEVECKHRKVLIPLTAGEERTRFTVNGRPVVVKAGETETAKVTIPRHNDGNVKVTVAGPFGERTLTVDVSKCVKPTPPKPSEECVTGAVGYDCKQHGIHVILNNLGDEPVKVAAKLYVDGKLAAGNDKLETIKSGKLDFVKPLKECKTWKVEFSGDYNKSFTGTCECPEEATPSPTPSATTPGTTPTSPTTPDDDKVIPDDKTPQGDKPMQPVGNTNPDGSLAHTGSDGITPLIMGAGATIALGAGTFFIARRRNRQQNS